MISRVALATGLGGVVLWSSVACAASPTTGTDADRDAATSSSPSASASPAPGETPPPEVRQGTTADSQRVTFQPRAVLLPGGENAEVRPAQTVRGELQVPENVAHVGWWDGSAAVGDPFGSTVIAGHVDSATEGLGYFARLLSIEKGEQITVGDGEQQLDYRVTSVKTVTKQALAVSSGALDQQGSHRLVLITCTGAYDPDTGYDSNLVVTAEPMGPAR